MIIAGDKNQFAQGSHYQSNLRKHNQLKKMGVEIISLPLPVGDYILVDKNVEEVIKRAEKRNMDVKKMDLLGTYNLVVDTKKSLVEVAGNLCNSKNHERVKDDLLRAKRSGIKVIWLIENTENVKSIDDLFAKGKYLVQEHGWKNVRGVDRWMPIHQTKVACSTLAKTLYTMSKKKDEYDIEFEFCRPDETGQRIVDNLMVK